MGLEYSPSVCSRRHLDPALDRVIPFLDRAANLPARTHRHVPLTARAQHDGHHPVSGRISNVELTYLVAFIRGTEPAHRRPIYSLPYM